MKVEFIRAHRERVRERHEPPPPQCYALACLLADTQLTAMQTTSVRWNLSGQAFEPLRTLLYYQSRELSRAVDEVGEHLRSLGAALSFNHQMLEQAGSVADCEPDADAVVLVRQLVEAHEAVERTTEAVLEAGIAWGDGATVALARARQLVHARMRKTLAIASPAPL